MASTTQTAGNRPPFLKASAATVDQSIPVNDGQSPTPYGSHEWLNSNGWNGRERRNRRRSRFVGGLWVQLCYALIDVICVLVNGALAFGIRFSASDLWHAVVSRTIATTIRQSMAHNWGFLLLYTALILLFCRFQDLYSTPRTRFAWEESFAVVKAVSFATLLLTAFIYLSGIRIVSRMVVVASFLSNIVTLAAWRYAKRKIVIRRVERGIGTRNAVIVGAGKVGQALARQLDENKLWGYRFKGFLDANHSGDSRLLGKIEELPRIARAEFVDEVFITIPSERELVKSVAMEAGQCGLHVTVVPDMYDGLGWHAPLRHLGDFPLMDLEWQTIPSFGLYVKRALDIVASVAGLILCFPLILIIALWIKIDSKGPVFYRSRRVGKKGYVFTCYKLRTMVVNADELKDSLRCRNERQGPFFKINDDPRITRIGKVLRKFSIDEIPQLWNVLKGDMSLVGPRPHPLDDYKQYDIEHLRRLEVKPGITGLWQVTSRQDPSFEKNMHLDLEYIESWNLWMDLMILVKTIPAVFQGDGQ
jgi:exopolysaccharide biosynthesis polyprenyl glycosylphosphotransferase